VFSFTFDEYYIKVAQVCLNSDDGLRKARFYLVPKYIQEPGFWRNYFYRVYVIKQSFGVYKPPDKAAFLKSSISLPSSSSSASSSTLPSSASSSPSLLSPATNVSNSLDAKWEDELKAELEEELTLTEKGAHPSASTSAPSVASSATVSRLGTEDWEEQIRKELEEELTRDT